MPTTVTLRTFLKPHTSNVAARDRSHTTVKVVDICEEVKTAKKVMLEQLIERIFTKEASKTRRVLLYMSKNMCMEEMVLDEADMQGWCVNEKTD